MNNLFGKNLHHYRTHLNITQKQLGEKLGVHYTQIWRWETGRRIPNIYEAIAIANALEVSVLDLTQ
jgi:transcriptional regulator with XRE-family HTH domain